MRGFLGRRRAYEQYRRWVVSATLKLVQARVRGVFERRRWQKRKQAVLQTRSATAIAAALRGCVVRRSVATRRRAASLKVAQRVLAVLLQARWRSYCDRQFVRVLRRETYARGAAENAAIQPGGDRVHARRQSQLQEAHHLGIQPGESAVWWALY